MDDLLKEFLTETAENLAALDVELVKFEQDPDNAATLGNIFRMMHTIKGTCGFLGLQRLEAVAHAGENVLGKFRDGELAVSEAAVTVILRCIDRIRQILAALEESGSEPEADDSALIADLNAIAQGGPAASDHAGPSAVSEAPAMAAESSFPVAAELLCEVEAALAAGIKGAEDQTIRAELRAESRAETKPAPLAAPRIAVKSEEPKAAAPQASESKDTALAGASIRVGVDVLESLMTLVSELVLTRNSLLQMVRGIEDSDFKVPLQRLSHITSDLQDGVMKTRMQPIGNAWSKLPRIVRDLSIETGKKINLQMQGAETELDRQVLELIKDPLTHMVRNSADHGLESPDDRRAAGKDEVGTINLKAYHEGGHIIILIADDGRGLNVERIRAKAVANGLATEAELDQMTERQILQFIFKAGFSTAETVTSVSGRGVGMDVVRTNIEKIGGTVEMQSAAGRGTSFTIKIPLTLAIVSALVVESASVRFAIPQLNVLELVRTSPRAENRIEMINQSPVLRLRDRLLPLVNLRTLLRQDQAADVTEADLFIVVAQVGTYNLGIIVDRVFDTEEIVVKPVSPLMRDIPFYSGNTILGDGSVIMILDPNGIAAASGQVQMQTGDTGDARAAARSEIERTSFLVFRSNATEFKAVPLALVARLEEIDAAKVERTRGQYVVQYRDHLMPLIPFDQSYAWRFEGKLPVLVLSEGGRSMGLVVEEIVDVVADEMKVELGSDQPGLIGSAVIGGRAMDIVDVGAFLTGAHADWFSHAAGQDLKIAAKRALIVDPSAFVRDLLTPHLAGAGWNVKSVSQANEVDEVANSDHGFDLAIVNPVTSGLDAAAFAKTLRTNRPGADITLIALTDTAGEADIRELMDAGYDRCFAKSDWTALVGHFRTLGSDHLPHTAAGGSLNHHSIAA